MKDQTGTLRSLIQALQELASANPEALDLPVVADVGGEKAVISGPGGIYSEGHSTWTDFGGESEAEHIRLFTARY